MSNDKEIVDIELTDEQLDALLDGLDESHSENIEDVLHEERIIYLNGEITNETVNYVVPLIHYYNALDDRAEIPKESRSPIKIYVRSQGGSVHDGLNIVAAMEASTTPIWTICDGNIGYSMGFIIFISGHYRLMSRHAFLLYHEIRASQDVSTFAEMKNLVEHYRVLQDKLDMLIVERTKIPMKKLKEQRKKNMDWFIDFDQAQKYQIFDKAI